MKKDDTLALKVRDLRDTISHILFCVHLIYADENVNVSVTTRFEGSGSDVGSGDHNIEENKEWICLQFNLFVLHSV